MKVLLVNPSAERCVDTFMTPLGILSIASFVEQFGHIARVYDREVNRGDFAKYLKDFMPDMIGVSVISGKAVNDAVKITSAAKSLGIKVVWGGLMPSCHPEFVLKESGADIVCIGEGEHTFLELIDAIETGKSFDTVKGLAYIGSDGQVLKTQEPDLIDLSELPALDWDLIDVRKYFKEYYGCKKMLYTYSSKGCPGHCTFCYNEFYNRSTRRRRPIQTVLGEIEYLCKKYSMDGTYFADDLLFQNKEDMREFCSAIIASGLSFHWGGYIRVFSSFEHEDYQFMFDAGCRWLYFGIESGSKNMQHRIKKGIDFEKIEPTFTYCADVGIEANALFIIGFPDETEQELKDTVNLARKINSSQKLFAYYTPIYSSASYRQLLENKIIKAPSSLREVSEQELLDKISDNYSAVPDAELRVIRSYFLWKRFVVKKTFADEKPFSFTIKIIINSFKGLRYFNIEIFSIAFKMIGYFFDIAFHPGIRKKYGLK